MNFDDYFYFVILFVPLSKKSLSLMQFNFFYTKFRKGYKRMKRKLKQALKNFINREK